MEHATTSPGSLPALDVETRSRIPPEILLTVFEKIQDAATMRNLRLVSSQFEELATPIWCREIILTPGLVAQYSQDTGWADHSMLQVHLTVHTTHVIIKQELNWVLVKKLLSTLKNLRSLLWIEWPSANASDHESLLAFEEIRDGLPHLDYLVEAFRAVAWRVTRLRKHPDTRYYDRSFATRHISSIQHLGLRYLPTAQFSSLKFVEWDQFSYEYVSPLLLCNDRLKTLHIAGKNTGVRIAETDIGDEDCLPPIEELSLQNYDWDHSLPIINSFWNWTNLRSLELKRVPILHFLYTVPAEYLEQLQVFKTDGFCLANSDQCQATRSLSTLISRICGLHELSLTCNVGDQCFVSSLVGHGATLHTLELRSYNDPFATHLADKLYQKRVNRAQLNSIRALCPQLSTLVLDYHPRVNDLGGLNLGSEEHVLAAFRNLRRLKVYAWTCHRVDEASDEPRMAINYRNARGWNERLALRKQGARFEHIILQTEVWNIHSDVVGDATFAAEVSVVYGDL